MLHLILRALPAPLHRQAYRIADWTRRKWRRVARPRHNSAHIVAFDDAGRVLLVKHSYGPPKWLLPGGGIERGEAPADAARREFHEELSCEAADLVALEPYFGDDSGARATMNVFAARLVGTPSVDMREIVAVRLYDPDALPHDAGRYVAGWVRRARAARSQQG